MLVKATRRGFYVKLREPGQEFDVPDALFSARWMKRVSVTEQAEVPAEVVVAPETPEPIAAPVAVAPVVKKRRGRRPKAVSE
jgi:hypothetical protein